MPQKNEEEEKQVKWTSSAVNKKKSDQDQENEFLDSSTNRNLVSAATQYSEQEPLQKHSVATQWSPIDSFTAKSIPGYTGHLPGRYFVTPGKTFRQEIDSILTNFHTPPMTINPLSRHFIPKLPQQQQLNSYNESELSDDPYFDKRPPSTYVRNYNPIPGYQGFVPRVRTSTSSLGIRYTKAVENSLHALHEKQYQEQNPHLYSGNTELGNSPKKLLDQRPLHTPRHRPHPHHEIDGSEDWTEVYKRPPSTYRSNGPIYIPGYRGYVPHLRESANAIGVRYSKAAQLCHESSLRDIKRKAETYRETCKDDDELEKSHESKQNSEKAQINEENSNSSVNSRLQKNDRPYRQEHIHYLSDRRPSTYIMDERHPIPGYQGFIPRMRDSPSTLGLRYTKAAIKTLQDLHRLQSETTKVH